MSFRGTATTGRNYQKEHAKTFNTPLYASGGILGALSAIRSILSLCFLAQAKPN